MTTGMIRLTAGSYFRIQYNEMVHGFYAVDSDVTEKDIDFYYDEIKMIPCRQFRSRYAWFYKYKEPYPLYKGKEVRGIKFECQK